MIDDYHFASITVDGQEYNRDVEIRCGGQSGSEVLPWQRKESHFIDIEDIKGAFDKEPEIIIIGTGDSAVAKVSEKVGEELQKRGIGLIIKPTGEAVGIFNGLKGKKAIGFFHLTC